MTSREIKIREKKANIPGLQLADILAYPMRQQMLLDKGVLPASDPVFGRQLASIAQKKYNKNESNGRVPGYGEIWL